MKTWSVLLLFVGAADDKNLFPVKTGSKWVYVAHGHESTVTVEGTEKKGDQELTVLRREAGDKSVKEFYAVTEKGVYFVPQGLDDNPVPRLKFGTKKGDTWTWKHEQQEGTYENQGEEEIEVPAGKFKAIKIHVTAKAGENEYEVTRWYASGVGVVKEETFRDDETWTLELKSFEEGK